MNVGWAGRQVCVAGLGVSGPPAARALAAHGAQVIVVDGADTPAQRERAAELDSLGITVRLGEAVGGDPRHAAGLVPGGTELVVTSPGWRPDAPLLVAAQEAGIPIIGDVELAWRLRPVLDDGGEQVWLAVTGTNGKTTTVKMLAAMLAAAGYRSIAAGNVGTSIVDVVTDPQPYRVVAVELSSFQLHWSATVRPFAATVLNVAPDHIDWHGSLDAYAHDKGRVFAHGTIAICNAADRWSRRLAAQAPAVARTVAFTLEEPGPQELGVVADRLVDRAFAAGPGGAELAAVTDIQPFAPHNVADALAAAALARAYGVTPEAVRDGLRAFDPEPHRITHVARVRGVNYVDDSKATNPHAAAASLAAYPSIIWVAGGLLKGADVDDLVVASAGRLRAAVLLGRDREKIRETLARHAPNVHVVEVAGTETRVMDQVVTEAARLAEPGDTVLLAPAAASLDMFPNYGVRGDAFAAAVRRLARQS